MSTAFASPGATPIIGRTVRDRSSSAPESTEIWLSGGAFSSFFDDAVGAVRVAERVIRNSGTLRVTRNVDAVDWDLLTFGAEVEPGEQSVVDVLANLRVRLGVSERTLNAAADINSRTHNNWKKKPETTPRAGSLGRLWSLMRAVDDLEAHLAGRQTVKEWLAEHHEHVASLKAGQFRRVVENLTQSLRADPASVPVVEFGDDVVDGPSGTSTTDVTRATDAWSLDGEIPRVVLD